MSTYKRVSLVLILLITALLTIVFCVTATASTTVTIEFAGGIGTEDDPYLIETKYHLDNVRNYLDSHFKLISDIVFTEDDFAEGGAFYNDGLGWTPIGFDRNNAFSGSLDGNYHTISNISTTFSGATHQYIGLFGYSTGTIKNVGIIDSSVSAKSDSVNLYVGGIVGYNYRGLVSGCYYSSSISSDNYCGGIVGANWGTIEECYNIGTISSENAAGGIVGTNYSNVFDSYNSGVVCGDSYAGGIAAINSGNIECCYNIGQIDSSYFCGGIAGRNTDIISACYYYEQEDLGVGKGVDVSIRCSLKKMQEKATFEGLDFENTWKIDTAIKYPFPTLRQNAHVEIYDNTTHFASGTGTEWDPYIIESKEHLNNIRNYLNSYFVLAEDIEFSDEDFSETGTFYNNGQGWLPIGNKTSPFTGTFNGGGHTISGLKISVHFENNVYLGLFGYSAGVIENINIQNSSITVVGDSAVQSTSYDYAYVGAVVGYGSAINCTTSGSIDISCSSMARDCYVYAGGVVGYGNATNCTNSSELTAKVFSGSSKYAFVYLGGVCGRALSVEKCHNSGIVTASTSRNNSNMNAGGIAGIATTVYLCSNSAKISASGGMFSDIKVGGICGGGGSGLSLKQSYNTGIIYGSSESNAGGIVGYIGGSGSVINAYNCGMIKGGYCGGIVGNTFGSATIKCCYNTGFIEDGYYKYAIGGSGDFSIINCYSLENMAKTRSSTIVCSLDEMADKNTFVGFDFGTVWQTSDETNQPWPSLQNILHAHEKIDVADCTVIIDKTEVQYHTASPKITLSYNGNEMVINQDYIAKYTVGNDTWLGTSGVVRNVGAVGTATIQIIGAGDFSGITTIEFQVTKFDISNAKLMTPWLPNGDGSYSSSSYDMKDFEYDGTEKKQTGYRVCDDNDTIAAGCFEVTYMNNIAPGTATMIITGKGDCYSGTLEKTFQIIHTHSGVLTLGQNVTCTVDGWKDYYVCICNKYFIEESCTNEITNLATWKLGEGKVEASHNYSNEWTRNSTHHWYECTDCDDQEFNKATHVDTDNNGFCNDCGYQMIVTPPPHNHAYGTLWEINENEHWNECECGNKVNKAEHFDNDNNNKCDDCNYMLSFNTPNDPQPPVDTPDTTTDNTDDSNTGAVVGVVAVSSTVVGVGSFSIIWFVIKKKSWTDLLAVFKK